MKLLSLLAVLALLAFGNAPAATNSDRAAIPVSDVAAYVYLHLTRNGEAPVATSCPGKIQAVRS
jgi:hypothetical protein